MGVYTIVQASVVAVLLMEAAVRGGAEMLRLPGRTTVAVGLPLLTANESLEWEVGEWGSRFVLMAEVRLPGYPRAHSNEVRALLSVASANVRREDRRGRRRGQSVLFVSMWVEVNWTAQIRLRVADHSAGKGGSGGGVMYVRRGGSIEGACVGGIGRDSRRCNGKGRCVVRDDDVAACECARGVFGDSCNERLLRQPRVTPRPAWDGEVTALPQSAVLRVSGRETYAFAWGGSGRAFTRVRVLEGGVRVHGRKRFVEGGGGVVTVACGKVRRGGELPSAGGGKPGVAEVAESTRTTPPLLEVVCQTGGEVRRGQWATSLWTEDARDAVVSVHIRPCGGKGTEDCPLATDGGVPWGVVAGALAVVAVLLAVVGALSVALLLRKRRSTRDRPPSAAWQRLVRVPSLRSTRG